MSSMPQSETEIIRELRRRAGRTHSGVVRLGIGDDAAVLRPRANEELVVTTDLSVEGTHFRRDWHPADSVGHRCLARGLSDVAAMVARPVAAFLSLALPKGVPQKWVREFFDGFLRLADHYDCPLAGGDTGASQHGIVADIMVIGAVPRGRAILRSAAKVGDTIYVTGSLGASAATLAQLSSLKKASKNNRHFYPDPRVAVASYLQAKKLAHAMIDLSDGLSTDLGHICDESKVGAILNRELIPISGGATIEQALHGGEDYELLFTASPRAKVPIAIAGVPVTEIGWMTRERGVYITDMKAKPTRLRPQGWEHFRKG